MEKKFISHVRAYRRRWGFTQDELAFLMGFKSRSVVTDLEGAEKLPTIDIAFALFAVFGTDGLELFPSLFRKVREGVVARAHERYDHLQGSAAPMTRAKLDFLEELFARASETREIDVV